jgi:hypothetical protein
MLEILRAKGLDCSLDRHLLFEQDILGILDQHSRVWRQFQRNIYPTVSEVAAGNDLVLSAQIQLNGVLEALKSQKCTFGHQHQADERFAIL